MAEPDLTLKNLTLRKLAQKWTLKKIYLKKVGSEKIGGRKWIQNIKPEKTGKNGPKNFLPRKI